ncbi:four helix bundle protein [Salinisphaera sp. P385]|uniref:Four helix bundle protein n=1 Tax=Spectribacter acetivorans TaxID=3075603 RepID=A0ABU3B7C4_9GAMM|nr:four helix bundle protein [Salinisphaera sp. P385]MDT0617985.1 four helix bundle protein [Salinisphaera sp. P385]
MGHRYEELTVWQKSMQMAENTYALTTSFPEQERFGLAAQLQRSAVSVASNIAEGQGRLSKAEFKRFLGIARGSINEAGTQMALAYRLHYVDDLKYREFCALADDTANLLNALIKSLEAPKVSTRNSKLETRNS